jgi:hypothetical protein
VVVVRVSILLGGQTYAHRFSGYPQLAHKAFTWHCEQMIPQAILKMRVTTAVKMVFCCLLQKINNVARWQIPGY